jgi:membrane fusion protein (multidrug efflux system)
MQNPEENAVKNEPTSAKIDSSPQNGSFKKKKALSIILILSLMFAIIGIRWWIRHQTHIETDNAFIESHVHPVASRISGKVVRVAVNDNQQVKKGDLLIEIDPADYRVQVDKASADVRVAKNEADGETSEAPVAQAAVQRARAGAEQATSDLARGRALFNKEVISREQFERIETAEKVAAAQLLEAQEALRRTMAVAGLSGGDSQAKVHQKRAVLAESELKLSYTRIYASSDGFITRRSVEQGNVVQVGQPLMALVPLSDAWITANYKERQLTHIRPGQKVEFSVDAYPGRKFTGRVDSIMAGTGAAFSLLPPENATGNYVKVVQRIPVKITIDPTSDQVKLLRMGMSVVPAVLVERRTSDILREMVPFL